MTYSFLINAIIWLSIFALLLICADTFALWYGWIRGGLRRTFTYDSEEDSFHYSVNKKEPLNNNKTGGDLENQDNSIVTTRSNLRGGGGNTSIVGGSTCSSIVSRSAGSNRTSTSVKPTNTPLKNLPEIRFMHTTKEAADRDIERIQQNPYYYFGRDNKLVGGNGDSSSGNNADNSSKESHDKDSNNSNKSNSSKKNDKEEGKEDEDEEDDDVVKRSMKLKSYYMHGLWYIY